MLYVHKKSSTPIDPWPALRHGGPNDLDDAGVKGNFLVLFNVDIVQREGVWHYIFEFDLRDSLEATALAQFMGKTSYPNDMKWKQWLGADCTVISASVREEILKMPDNVAHTSAVITGMRECPTARPIPGRDPDDWFRHDLPENFLLTLPGQ